MNTILVKEQAGVAKQVEEPVIYALPPGNDEAVFEQVFKQYFKSLYAYALTLLNDAPAAEEAVQQVFCKIWERVDINQIAGAPAAYLYRAVHNQCLNEIKHRKVKAGHQLYIAHTLKNQAQTDNPPMLTRELETRLHDALNTLPRQCRTIFQLSRFEDLKYHEIANRLSISVKTVENQMGKALKLLRTRLSDLLMLLFFLLNT